MQKILTVFLFVCCYVFSSVAVNSCKQKQDASVISTKITIDARNFLNNITNNIYSNLATMNFSFDGAEIGYYKGAEIGYYKYKLDDEGWSDEFNIGSSISLSDLENGQHSIYIIGQDGDGHWQSEESAFVYTWNVDTTSPTSPTEIGPNVDVEQAARTYETTWSGGEVSGGSDDNLDHYLVKACTDKNCRVGCLKTLTVAGDVTSATVKGLIIGRTYSICVKAVDKANNSSPWAVSDGEISVIEE